MSLRYDTDFIEIVTVKDKNKMNVCETVELHVIPGVNLSRFVKFRIGFAFDDKAIIEIRT